MIRCKTSHCFRSALLAIAGIALASAATSAHGEEVSLLFEDGVAQAKYAAGELGRALGSSGMTVTTGDLVAKPDGSGTCIYMFDQSNTAMLSAMGLQGTREIRKLKAEGYALRVQRKGSAVRCSVVGSDAAGLMYGGLELAELIAAGTAIGDIKDVEHEPYMAMRGTKFNIPLDVRTPSYTDVCDAAQKNIPEMWSLGFWKEYIDTLARYRYNYVSLWSLHPFPSLVKLPDFPNVALTDVRRSTVQWKENYSLNGIGFDAPEILGNVEVVKEMTIDDKIAFWREVMRYGKERNVDFYFVTWNIFVNGTGGKYGITDSIDNPTTIKYFRQSVEQMFLTYPDLAGIGLTTGENMHGAKFDEKEDWAFATYAQGVLDALKKQPDRKITFIHRQHQTGAQDIARKFAPLIEHPNVEFIFSFKYAKAHVMSATKQPYHEEFVKDIGELKTIWTLRNDDNYYFRWGSPNFVREFMQNIPYDVSRGFYYGSDQYIWGREFLSLEPESPRQIEIAKHWYHWMLWGRLGYDPTLSNDRFYQVLKSRFPDASTTRLFAAWQAASMIYPLTTGFHWGSLDFQWYIEGCKSQRKYAQTESGFHDVNRFISLPPHARAGCVGVNDYLKSKKAGKKIDGATPAEVSQRIHAYADAALRLLSDLSAGDDKELRKTLTDIHAMALLGKYYAHKIKAAQDLGEFRMTKDAAHQQAAIGELNAAAHFWRRYAATALSQYKNPLWTNRVGYVNWRQLYQHVLADIKIAGGTPEVKSMKPTAGGGLVSAEAAAYAGLRPVARTVARTGAGRDQYLEAVEDAQDRYVEWAIEAPASGIYVLEFQYGLKEDGQYPCPLTINGKEVGELICWTTGGPGTWVWDRKVVPLKTGTNTIRLVPQAAVLVDHLNVLAGR